jgi:hypothetical protein
VGTRKKYTVSFRDPDGVRHSVDVGAETMYEAAVLALRSFREHGCAPGPAAHLAIAVKSRSGFRSADIAGDESTEEGFGDL